MPLDLLRIRAICFDIDGTLSDTDDEWIQGLEKHLRPLLFFLSPAHIHALARWLIMSSETPGNWLFEVLDRLNLDQWIHRMSQQMRGKRPLSPPRFRLIPGVPILLHNLYHHYPLAIVSARDESTTLAFLDRYTLRHFFRVVVTAQTTPHTKPLPDPLIWAANAIGVEPHECLMVGDTPPDIRAGRAAGAQTVGVLCGFGSERELRRAGADLILPSPVHLLALLPPPHFLS